MDRPGPGGGNFEQLLGDLLQLMGGATPGVGRVELARTLAQGAATGGQVEGNVDPASRIRFEELVHVAELHVAELTGLSVTPTGAPLEVVAVGPGAWAWRTIEDWRFLFDAAPDPRAPAGGGEDRASAADTAASGLGLLDLGPTGPADGLEPGGQGTADLVARWLATMGPMLTALQLGSAVGHLARVTLGQYELPIPRPSATSLLVVPANVDAFARDWSLPADEVGLWVCLRDVATHAVITRPHVAQRLQRLLTEVVRGTAEDAVAIADRFEGLDPGDPESLQRILGDPESLLGTERPPERQRVADELVAVTSALFGYVEHIVDRAGARLLGGRTALAEAWRRRQVDRETSDRGAELLLGLDLGPTQLDRGRDFVRGVVDRAGEEGPARLWSDPHALPTPAEIDAPGLWLERTAMGDGLPPG